MRGERQEMIQRIIAEQEIETQMELCEELRKRGCAVTQATVSRDVKQMHLLKVAGTEKKYRYAYIEDANDRISPRMHSLFRECVVSVESARNLVVVKTLRGNGSNAGVIVDKMNLPEIVGSIAGDDTLLIVAKDDGTAKSVVAKLNSYLI